MKDWYSDDEKISVSGKIELFQLSEYDPVDFEINLQGVQGGNDYYVYSVSCFVLLLKNYLLRFKYIYIYIHNFFL